MSRRERQARSSLRRPLLTQAGSLLNHRFVLTSPTLTPTLPEASSKPLMLPLRLVSCSKLTWYEQEAGQIQSPHFRITLPNAPQMLFQLRIATPHPSQDFFRRLLIHAVRLVYAHPASV